MERQFDQQSDYIATRLELMSGTVEHPSTGEPHPVIVYKFSRADGKPYPDVVLFVDPEELSTIRRQTSSAVDDATTAARKLKKKRKSA